MGAYGEHSSQLRNFEGFKLVINLKETKEAKCKVRWNFSGSNTDGSFISAVSNSFFSPLEKNPLAADLG